MQDRLMVRHKDGHQRDMRGEQNVCEESPPTPVFLQRSADETSPTGHLACVVLGGGGQVTVSFPPGASFSVSAHFAFGQPRPALLP